jgi:hypothetical protein
VCAVLQVGVQFSTVVTLLNCAYLGISKAMLLFRHADLIALGTVYAAMWEQQLTANDTAEEQESEGAVNNGKTSDRNE